MRDLKIILWIVPVVVVLFAATVSGSCESVPGNESQTEAIADSAEGEPNRDQGPTRVVGMTTNVFQRTFLIKTLRYTGTCFAIDYDGRQYLVTAKHMLKGMFDEVTKSSTVRIFHDHQWKSLEVALVGEAEDPVDIAVLAPEVQIAESIQPPLTSGEADIGQDVYFLGFPFELQGDVGALNRDFPVALVKKAALSAVALFEGRNVWLLDGLNAPGFSGAPVVYAPNGRLPFNVGAVVSGYRHAPAPVFDGSDETRLSYRYNTGIIIADRITHATELIERNPIGFELSTKP